MINLFALCKNDLFIRAIEQILNKHEIYTIDICIVPDLALPKFLQCNPRPDIILLDANWNFKNYSGAALLKMFLNLIPPPKIILVTNSYEESTIKKLKELGANGYFYRTISNIDSITDCIKNVYKGKPYFAGYT